MVALGAGCATLSEMREWTWLNRRLNEKVLKDCIWCGWLESALQSLLSRGWVTVKVMVDI